MDQFFKLNRLLIWLYNSNMILKSLPKFKKKKKNIQQLTSLLWPTKAEGSIYSSFGSGAMCLLHGQQPSTTSPDPPLPPHHLFSFTPPPFALPNAFIILTQTQWILTYFYVPSNFILKSAFYDLGNYYDSPVVLVLVAVDPFTVLPSKRAKTLLFFFFL